MARQKSILKLQGTIGGISFYKSKDGYLAREKGGVDASRIANDPSFARTRENGSEFANAATAGKMLRDAIRILGKDASDSRVTSRLTQIMAQIKNMDEANARGERSVAEGMQKPEAKLLLKGFNFNNNAVLGSVLFNPYQIDTVTGEISVEAISPQDDIRLPEGATHIVFRSGFASVDFATGGSEITVSEPVRLAVNALPQALSVKPAAAPALEGTRFIMLSIDFVQSVNDVDYSLKNNAFNVLAIVEVI
ncbi:MAG: hypothetical protein PHG64_00900 [Paludibacter sp.]|nr:hypothetical protein [Paludibacter sp.]